MGVLTVFLEKLTDLRDTDAFKMINPKSIMDRSDPLVKLRLEQDNRFFDKDYGTQESSQKRETQNPDYDETFTFEDVDSLKKLVLHIQVIDYDEGMGSMNDDSLGNCSIKLDELSLSEEPKEYSQEIDRNGTGGWFSQNARVHLKLSFKE